MSTDVHTQFSIMFYKNCVWTIKAWTRAPPDQQQLVSVKEESCIWLKIKDARYHSKRNKDINLLQSFFLTGVTDLDMGRTQITDLLLTPRADTNLR